MLIALRDFSIGDVPIERGEVISAELQRALPAGRLPQLKNTRFVEEITDERAIEKAVEALTARVEALEAQAGKAPATRTPRKRKAAA